MGIFTLYAESLPQMKGFGIMMANQWVTSQWLMEHCDQCLMTTFGTEGPIHNILGLLWPQNFQKLFLINSYTYSLDYLSKCALLIISEVDT